MVIIGPIDFTKRRYIKVQRRAPMLRKSVPLIVGVVILGLAAVPLLAAEVDPDLKPGFPVKAYHQWGMSFGGLGNNTLVADIDGGGDLEIIAAGSIRPLYAWKSDGSVVTGWPVSGPYYCAAGELSNSFNGSELVCSAHSLFPVYAYTDGGAVLPGWPVSVAQSTPPSLADIDHDGIDEIFVSQGNLLNALKADGSNAPGWPASAAGIGERMTAAIADLDGDGELEIVTAGIRHPQTGAVNIDAFHHDGTRVTGFPIVLPTSGYEHTFPVIGDVDGDGVPEIIALATDNMGNTVVYIYSGEGVLKRTIPLNNMIGYVSAPALADLDGDGIPEIIVQLETSLAVVRGTDGTSFPGWPVQTGGLMGWSSPVVGDVDGDGLPDIVILTHEPGYPEGSVEAYNRAGHLLPRFPKADLLLGDGAVPAIADLDRKGRNQIIVTGSYGFSFPNTYDKVWVYDLGAPSTGPVQWGQFMEGAKHNGYYRGGFGVPNDRSILDVKKTGTGTGTITAPGIDCGIDCSGTFTTGTLVTLTATPHDPDSTFVGWEGGGCSGAGDCVVDLQSDTLVTAVFDLVYVDLTVARAGTGSGWVISNPYGIECLLECTRSFVRGASVTLTVSTAYDGSQRFDGWTGGGCGGTGQCTVVVMSGNTTVTAAITAGGLIKVGVLGKGKGVISSSPAGIDCGSDCEEFYPQGTELTLTPIAAEGSRFIRWYGGSCVLADAACALTISGSGTFAAEFGKILTIESIIGLTLRPRDGKFALFWTYALDPSVLPRFVKIDLSRDGGATWMPVSKKTPNIGRFYWKVKLPETNRAMFRICGLDHYTRCEQGDAFIIRK